jgi:pimeloyl-ACP methyl ester carboxylesterase
MGIQAMHRGGSGEPLVLLHGFTDTWRTWTPLLEELERHHDVLAPTLPGHHGGEPFAPSVELSIATVVDAIEREMDEAGFETAHLAGSSLGGWLALELAVRGRARSVVAICPGGGWEYASREASAVFGYFRRSHKMVRLVSRHARTIASRPRLKAVALRELVANPARVPAHAAADMLEGAAGCAIVLDALELQHVETAFSDLGPIECEVRIAYGTRDRLIRWPSHYGRLQRLLPEAEYVALEGLGHLPMWEDPARVTGLILEVTTRARQTAQV